MQGLSIANNLLASRVQYNLDNNQASLQNTVTQLSSGLRINSAADDPSGLAIATNLQTQVDAFNTASQNVQDANNAAQVADGALATETDILQRIRNLAVEASSSINSSSDTANLQAEVSQLLLEVNRISQSVNFNGQPLLDGSHSGFQAYVDANYDITNNAVLAETAGSATSTLFTNGNFNSPPEASGAGPLAPPTGWTVGGGGNVLVYNGAFGTEATTPAGSQAAYFGTVGGTLSQTISGLQAGTTYTVSFLAGNGAGTSGNFSVTANGNNVTPASTALAAGAFTSFTSQSFTANASGQATVTFTNTGPDGFESSPRGAVNLLRSWSKV